MEDKLRWMLITAVAPVLWGSTYFVTARYLPADAPFWGAVLRALPAGLVLLALCRRLPRGAWWWRSLVLGSLNAGIFFALVYLAAQWLPTGVAATVMALSPAVMMLLAWGLLGEKPVLRMLTGAVLGLAGVALMLLGADGGVRLGGVLAAGAAMTMSALGAVLARRWSGEVPVLTSTAWQLLGGAVVMLPVAVLVESAPPELDGPAVVAFAGVSLLATGVAFICWFGGLQRLQAGTVALIGLLNPVTGVLLGLVAGQEQFTVRQALGMTLVLIGIGLGRPGARSRAGNEQPDRPPAIPR